MDEEVYVAWDVGSTNIRASYSDSCGIYSEISFQLPSSARPTNEFPAIYAAKEENEEFVISCMDFGSDLSDYPPQNVFKFNFKHIHNML